jgi:prepilin-type N-terminal cleavage/methylation domain-containing protein
MNKKQHNNAGFSLVELMVVMTITLTLMGTATTLLGNAFGVKARQIQRASGITSTQAALNVMSREIGNSGFGLTGNGIVADSNLEKLHFRANIQNDAAHSQTNDPGENVTYYYDSATQSIMRYDAYPLSPSTTVIINGVSNVSFAYFDYQGTSSTGTPTAGPTANTGHVRITLTAVLDAVQGQPNGQSVTLTSDVSLRNSAYMLNQY